MSIGISILFALVGGVYVMYETKGFWGLESNPNANTMNNSLNAVSEITNISFIMIPIILILLFVIFYTTRLGF